MKFEYFRFLLSPVKDPQLPFTKPKDRKDIIKTIFQAGKPYEFTQGRARYGFVVRAQEGQHVLARLGKYTSKTLYSSPSRGFQDKEVEDWPGCHVLINLDDEKGSGKTKELGQMIAIEVNRSAITNNLNALRSFADKINEEIIELGFFITINPILTQKRKFWPTVQQYQGKIRKVVLRYTPPNLFDLKNKLEDDLRAANKKFNTTSTEIVLENSAGKLQLPQNDALLKQSAEYIDLGSGTFALHLQKGKKVIKSEAGARVETFEGLELSIQGKSAKDAAKIIKDIWERISD